MPVDVNVKAWIDEKCPLDDCEEKCISGCKIKMHSSQVKGYVEEQMKQITVVQKSPPKFRARKSKL